MLSNIISDSTNSVLLVKFDNHIKVSTLDTATFTLWLDSTTPEEIELPFHSVEASKDYNSITRTLKLWVTADLDANTPYTLEVENVEYAGSGVSVTDSVSFTLDVAIQGYEEIVPDPVEIEDHSIKSTIEIDTGLDPIPVLRDFYLVGSDPIDNDYFVDADHDLGVISLSFSETPDTKFLNSKYVKVLRKKVQVAPSRWEKIGVKFSVSSTEPIVYLSFPAIGSPTTYKELGFDYFESGYTYKITLSRYIKAA